MTRRNQAGHHHQGCERQLREAGYAKVTEELTLKWARLRQRVEATVKTMRFLHAGAVRPGFSQPGPGIRSQVRVPNWCGGAASGIPILCQALAFAVHHLGEAWPRHATRRLGQY